MQRTTVSAEYHLASVGFARRNTSMATSWYPPSPAQLSSESTIAPSSFPPIMTWTGAPPIGVSRVAFARHGIAAAIIGYRQYPRVQRGDGLLRTAGWPWAS
jgi:hypothetical protein